MKGGEMFEIDVTDSWPPKFQRPIRPCAADTDALNRKAFGKTAVQQVEKNLWAVHALQTRDACDSGTLAFISCLKASMHYAGIEILLRYIFHIEETHADG
jgi:hypothetical protein